MYLENLSFRILKGEKEVLKRVYEEVFLRSLIRLAKRKIDT